MSRGRRQRWQGAKRRPEIFTAEFSHFFMSIFFRLSLTSTPKKFPKFFRLRRAQIIGWGGRPPTPSSLKKKALGLGGGGAKTVGEFHWGACEIFGEEFSHFFMTNVFDLHPQKKPKIFPPAAEKIIGGGGDPPIPPKKKSPNLGNLNNIFACGGIVTLRVLLKSFI